MNCARGMVKSVGGRLPGASGECLAKRVREHLPAAIRDALTSLLDQIEQLSKQLRDYDKQIEQMAKTESAPLWQEPRHFGLPGSAAAAG